jgi:hypothetical protein
MGALAVANEPAEAIEADLAAPEPDAPTPTPPPTSTTALRASPSPAVISPIAVSVPPPAAPFPAPEPVAGAPRADIAAWRSVLARVRAVKPALASVFEHGVPLEVSPARVLIAFEPDSFLAAQAAEAESLEVLTREVRGAFGAATHVALDLSAKAKTGSPTVASLDAARRKEDTAKARAAVEAHPLVQKAMSALGAELKEVRLPLRDD